MRDDAIMKGPVLGFGFRRDVVEGQGHDPGVRRKRVRVRLVIWLYGEVSREDRRINRLLDIVCERASQCIGGAARCCGRAGGPGTRCSA